MYVLEVILNSYVSESLRVKFNDVWGGFSSIFNGI